MSLSDFRVDAAPPAPKTEKGPLRLRDGSVLAFDQSVGMTGWAWLQNGPGGLLVRDCGSIKTEADDWPKGHEGTLQRAVYVHDEMEAAYLRCKALGQPPLEFVHETPPVGGKMARPESSLITGLAVRLIAKKYDRPLTMVQNQNSKKILVNNGNATKPQWHVGLKQFTFGGDRYPTNEGQRDALCLAVTRLVVA